MQHTLFYQVKGIFFRRMADENNPVVINKVFKDNNPIVAREKAFDYYQNYIELFLESVGKTYVSHEQTIADLQDFLNSYQPVKTVAGMEMESDFDKGAAIYLIESPETYTTVEGETVFTNKKLIHYIDKNINIDYKQLSDSLCWEYYIYEKQKYDCKDYIKHYQHITRDSLGHIKHYEKFLYLNTPINFEIWNR
jgi:hypothetical protein